ncbi:MAG TPA: hypothetical protein VJ742_13315 [Nitrososphaera sp.]|nr:hypothetical protein [Nitrososphaera sp.]
MSEREQKAYIREIKTEEVHHIFVRLVDSRDDIAGGLDAIYTLDIDASVDFDADGKLIGISLLWCSDEETSAVKQIEVIE